MMHGVGWVNGRGGRGENAFACSDPVLERGDRMVEESCYCEFLLIHLPYANTRLPQAPNTKGTASCQWINFFSCLDGHFCPLNFYFFLAFPRGPHSPLPITGFHLFARKGTKTKMHPGKAQIVDHLQSQNTLFQYDFFNPCVKSWSGKNNKGHGL